MNRKLIPLLALLPLTCSSLDNFTVEQSSTTMIPGANAPAGDIGFADFASIDIADSQELENEGVDRQQIDSVKLGSLDLTVAAPSGNDLSFFDSIEFFVEAPGLTRRRIARGTSFPLGQTTVSLAVDDVELIDYVDSESMTITTEVSGTPPPSDTTVRSDMTVLVDVNVGGIVCGEAEKAGL